VGLETPFSQHRKVGRMATVVAVLGVIIPFFAGFALVLGLGYGQLEALFIGAAMVATSVGITARVIKDLGLTRSIESRVIIGAAVIDDVLGMIVLAIVLGIAQGGSAGVVDIVLVSATGIIFVLLVIFFGSIILPKVRRRMGERKTGVERPSPPECVNKKRFSLSPLPLAIIVCLGLAFAADYVGLAAIIGAFLAGMVFAEFKDRWPCEEDFHPINQLLVPFFFLFVGMSVNLGSFGEVLVLAVAITLLAIVTKYIGCGIGSQSLGRGSANIIGVGMIPRGEVGIIIATIGLSMAAISPNMFSVVVFMSMVTTILAPFLLMWAFKRRYGTCDPNGQVEQSDVSG
jgi:Kef-type K+ transport system membrane component KefB